MADSSVLKSDEKAPLWRRLLSVAFFAAIGGIVGYGSVEIYVQVFDGDFSALEVLNSSEIMAFALAVIFAAIALALLASTYSSKSVSKQLTKTWGEVSPEEVAENMRILRMSGLCMMAYAVILAVMAFGRDGGLIPMVIIMAMLVVMLAINWSLWQSQDELYHSIMRDAGAMTFTISESLLILWAAASIAGLGIAFRPIDVVMVLLGVYVVASIIVTVRKGMV